MVIVTDSPNAMQPSVLQLDPFSYVPEYGSAIRGLYGQEALPDPLYVFHTPYVDYAPGMVEVDVQFTDLWSRQDRMVISVHALDHSTQEVKAILKSEVSLRTLAANGGKAMVRFEAEPGLGYAILARTIMPPDATATALTVTSRSYPGRPLGRVAQAGAGGYRPAAVRNVASLLAHRVPTLATPMSQACTASQLTEPVFREWVEKAALVGPADRTCWEIVFPLQTFRYFGVFETKSHGLGLGDRHDAIAPAIHRLGATTEHHAWPGDAPPTLPDAARIRDFDFLWSHGLCTRFGATRDLVHFIEDSLEYLRPGGLAVHVLTATLGCPDGIAAPSAALSRNALAQLALAVVGGKNEIAQMTMTVDPADTDLKSFGVVIRKAA